MVMNNKMTDKNSSCQCKETNEILSDTKLVKEIKLAESEMKKGKGIPWEKVKVEILTAGHRSGVY